MAEMTFKDLKTALEKLTEEQLLMPVIVAREDDSSRINDLYISDYDFYYNQNDVEDCGSLKELEEIHGDDFMIEDYVLGSAKGTPMLDACIPLG